MADRLVLLGTKGGPAIRPGGPSPTSSLLDISGRRIVIDCGLGVTRALVNADLSLKDLDMILITHLHSDHVLEFGPLVHTAWTSGLAHKITVYGPAGIEDYWSGFLQSMRYDIDLRIEDEGRPDLRDLVDLQVFADGLVYQGASLTITALRVDHPPVVDCFALKIEASGKSIVFSADTAYFPPLAGFARGSDILVHEAMLPEGVDRLVARTGNGARLKEHLLASHTLVEDAARIAAAAEVKHLVLHHLIPADDPQFDEADWIKALDGKWDGRLTIGRDGLVIPL
ncbi:MBL fold metallo-hydrolase [Phyllobacterium calauticae]|uniref:MBL fold metallo-hydrolase n=1 Tax=Phyllobacterium calauticae TaxID=2817027 RepID=UPI001CBB0444|nr:MBL fold metallo-hydrolase [Phyllobacterium calauticae]MBZ3691543.1 MBL fold metallo-hydrolase [Phyllobacterium calauticae]